MLKRPRRYEPWTNERLDKVLEGRPLERKGDVTNWNKKVLIHCKVCGNDFEALPQNLERGSGCPSCYLRNKTGAKRKPKWTLKEVREFAKANGYTLLDQEYINNKFPLRFIDDNTGEETLMTLRTLQARVKAKEFKGKQETE
jgi:predicted Zn-ribbon and HTH transcriptional regulator